MKLELERKLTGLTAEVSGIAMSPDATHILAVGANHCSIIWDATTGAVLQRFFDGEDRIDGAAFSRDGKLLATSTGARLELRDCGKGWKRVQSVAVEERGLQRMAFSRKQSLIAATVLGAVKIFKTPSLELVATLPASGYLGRPSFSPDASTVASACMDVFVHRVADATVLHRFKHDAKAIQTYEAAYAPDGSLLATCGMHASLRLWRTTDYRLAWEVKPANKTVQAVAFAPHGRWLAVVSRGAGKRGALEVVDIASKKRVATAKIDWCPREALVVSADSTRIAIGTVKGASIYRITAD
jgi:WD40 repeat protein